MEQRPRPEQSPDPNNFDAWLTGLPDEELLRLVKAAEQPFVGRSDDPLGLGEAMGIAIQYHGDPYLNEEEATRSLMSFGIQLTLESLRRTGDVIKQGTSSLVPGEDTSIFTMTEHGNRNFMHKNPDTEAP